MCVLASIINIMHSSNIILFYFKEEDWQYNQEPSDFFIDTHCKCGALLETNINLCYLLSYSLEPDHA